MAEAGSKQRAKQALKTQEENAEVMVLASKFNGVLQNYGCHASAVIIIPIDPTNFCAIERQTDSKTGEIRYIAAYDFHDLENMGLLKQDILGLKTADVIQKTCDMVGVSYDEIDNLPDVDKKTFDMLCRGETAGCFQIESYGMTETVKRIQPHSIWDLVPLVALYRPGPKDAKLPGTDYTMLDAYIMRRHGEMELTYEHQLLEPILGPTYGIILYQEQVLAIARALCGYTLGQADVLRRIIGRKQVELIDAAITEMKAKGMANGIDGEIMDKVCDAIVTFANYGFNQGHSTAYGYIAYQTAWLKAHYTKEFMTCLINSEDGQEKILPYIEELRRLKITIKPPCVQVGNDNFSLDGGDIRIGLSYIKNVGALGLAGKDIRTYDILLTELPRVNKRVIEFLIKAGALDCFGERPALLHKLYNIDEEIQNIELKIRANFLKVSEIQGEIDKANPSTKKYQDLLKKLENRKKDIAKQQEKLIELKSLASDIRRYDDIDGEIEALGFSFKDKLGRYDLSIANEYKDTKSEQLIGGECVKFKPWKTKKGKPMAFLSVRTNNRIIDLVAFDRTLANGNLEVGKVYILDIEDGKLLDFQDAKKIS